MASKSRLRCPAAGPRRDCGVAAFGYCAARAEWCLRYRSRAPLHWPGRGGAHAAGAASPFLFWPDGYRCLNRCYRNAGRHSARIESALAPPTAHGLAKPTTMVTRQMRQRFRLREKGSPLQPRRVPGRNGARIGIGRPVPLTRPRRAVRIALPAGRTCLHGPGGVVPPPPGGLLRGMAQTGLLPGGAVPAQINCETGDRFHSLRRGWFIWIGKPDRLI